jgi:hypothetical protein
LAQLTLGLMSWNSTSATWEATPLGSSTSLGAQRANCAKTSNVEVVETHREGSDVVRSLDSLQLRYEASGTGAPDGEMGEIGAGEK